MVAVHSNECDRGYSATELKPTTKKSKIETMILVHTVSMFSGYMGPRASKTAFTA